MAIEYGSMVSLYLIPGMVVELKIPSDGGKGAFRTLSPTYSDGIKEYTLTNGFYEESQGAVGDLQNPSATEVAIEYHHKRPEENAIWFIPADDPESKVLFNVIAVPIHDHSSIVQGGPAYGTYFSDDDVEE